MFVHLRYSDAVAVGHAAIDLVDTRCLYQRTCTSMHDIIFAVINRDRKWLVMSRYQDHEFRSDRTAISVTPCMQAVYFITRSVIHNDHFHIQGGPSNCRTFSASLKHGITQSSTSFLTDMFINASQISIIVIFLSELLYIHVMTFYCVK